MVIGGVYSRPIIWGVEKKVTGTHNPAPTVVPVPCPKCGALMAVFTELRRCNQCGRIERAKESC
jgi:hypothetical protein